MHFSRALPSIRKAIMNWQSQLVNTWEATGYEHGSPVASQLADAKPIRIEVDGNFVVDVLDSADLACAMLHTDSESRWSGAANALASPGKHTVRLSRYCGPTR